MSQLLHGWCKMPQKKSNQAKIINLLQHHRVMDLKSLQKKLEGRSRASLFRDLAVVDYYSSYSHGGKYYTLKTTPVFDSYGLWHFRDIGFSEYGNLKDTIVHFVNSSKHGLKHLDLKDRLKIPVYNTLLDLVNSKQITRMELDGSYLYMSKDVVISKEQLLKFKEKRAAKINLPSSNIPAWMAIEVLSEVIRYSGAEAEPLRIAARLSLRGIQISFNQVKDILEIYEVKKTRPTR